MIPGIVAGQMILSTGGGTPGAWDPTDVTMHSGSAAFTFTNSDATVDNDASQSGTVRNTTNRTTGEKRYVEVVLDDPGSFVTLGLTVGFSSTPDAFSSNWNNSGNKNFTWNPDGTRYSHGQTNTEATDSTSLSWGTAGTVLQMAIEVGAGVTWVGINGGTLFASSGATFTESDVKVFACLGDGNFGAIGDHSMVTILTTAATQNYAAPAGFIPWDD